CVNDLIRLHYAPTILPGATEFSHQRMPPMRTRPLPRAYYDTIVRRDIFNLAPPPQARSQPVENEILPWRLVGTSLVSSGKPYAILENQMGVQTLYRVGENVPNAGLLLDVEPDRVVVLHNGHRVAIKMDLVTPAPGPPPPPMPGFMRRRPAFGRDGPGFGPGRLGMQGPGIRPLGENRFLVDRRMVDSELNNPAPLFTQMRATPNVVNGQPNGFLLTEIQPNSVFQQIGLQDGDLLSSVNGQSVGDPIKAMGLLQSLQNSPAITLNVIRNGAPIQLYYNIR